MSRLTVSTCAGSYLLARLTAETTARSDAVVIEVRDADAPDDGVAVGAVRALDVGGGLGVVARRHGVLGVVEDPHVEVDASPSASTNAASGPLPVPVISCSLPSDLHHGGDGVGAAVVLGRGDLLAHPLERGDRGQVLLGEDVPHLLRR